MAPKIELFYKCDLCDRILEKDLHKWHCQTCNKNESELLGGFDLCGHCNFTHEHHTIKHRIFPIHVTLTPNEFAKIGKTEKKELENIDIYLHVVMHEGKIMVCNSRVLADIFTLKQIDIIAQVHAASC